MQHTECDMFLSTSRFSLIQFTCKFICLRKQNPPYRIVYNYYFLLIKSDCRTYSYLSQWRIVKIQARQPSILHYLFYSVSTRQYNSVNRNVRIVLYLYTFNSICCELGNHPLHVLATKRVRREFVLHILFILSFILCITKRNSCRYFFFLFVILLLFVLFAFQRTSANNWFFFFGAKSINAVRNA